MSTRTVTADPATAYAKSVVAKKVVVNRWVRMACERHLHNLKDGAKRGLKFDREAAAHAIGFFDWLNLPEGDKPFVLSPFQKFILGSLFGWKGADGYRRFRIAYIETGKGSGKTPFAAGIALYGLTADGEQGAEVYNAGVTHEQANIGFSDEKKMASASPALAGRLEIGAHNIAHPESGSFLRPVSSEHRGLDGKRVHIAVVDEIHEHPNSLVVDKLRAGTKGRTQALIIEITNSGFDRETVCWQHHEYSTRVLQGTSPDDSWFAFICGLDPCEKCLADGKTEPVEGCPDCDDWRDPAVWPKANPNLGVSVTHKYLAEQVREAEGMPSKANIVKRLNFCIWTESYSTWIPDDNWMACADGFDPADLDGQECSAALDLAYRSDFAALSLIFDRGGELYLRTYFWLPEEGDRDHKREPIAGFVRSKLVELTPGPSTDFPTIRKRINELGKRYRIKRIGVDPWNARQLSGELIEDGFDVLEFAQTMRNYNEPTKEFEALVKAGKLHHDGNALMRWQMSNVVVETDASGNYRPSKRKSSEKIDGPASAIMALGTERTDSPKPDLTFYETHELEMM